MIFLFLLPCLTADLLNIAHCNRRRERLRISFLSYHPEADPDRLAAWFAARGLPVRLVAYTSRELCLDVPSALDFVVKAMLPKLAAYDLPIR